MRHGKKFNHLGRQKKHRELMLANMACSLIEHKRVFTTVAKAKALRKYVEPLVTKSKSDTMHSRRVVFSYLRDKFATSELFSSIRDAVINRPGGYTRIIKTGRRLGDGAEMAMIEFVDFNEVYNVKETKTKTRRRKKKASAPAAPEAPATEENNNEQSAE
ncbi:50S ribosomal protein L17 [Flammeovirga pacifica]|uniref:Large ribosomal subunit protein bL17 n=1 Tax=Flammeovirga pacifica TaxID=915059 RepID=A0A1S1Z394_FLAPC|nr:50S ribosomal protein L17 [Flammeovirga pacifica]OHX67749.1 50S ribosomal protein L17 [Flammeovirga pacifica]